jgi:peptidoglycan/LPS O-acetylase OafA/YrhL
VDARRFIVRRMFKIWPAYYVLILFHAIVGRHPLDSFLWQNLTHLQNYFGTSISQTWSLAVEEHFYLFLPAVLLLFARWKMRAGSIIGVLGGICLIVLIARCLEVAGGGLQAAFFYTQYRIDSLLYGVILAAIYWMKPDVYQGIAKRTGWLLAVVAVLVAWLVLATKHEPLDESIGYTIQAIGFCAFIVLMLEHSAKVRDSFAYRAIAWLGVYSYGIYLWHSLALAPGDMVIRKATALGLPPAAIWFVALAVQSAIAIIAGYVMTRAVEYPFLRLRNALFPARRNASVREEMPVGGQLS